MSSQLGRERQRLWRLWSSRVRRGRDFDYLFILTYGRSGSTLLQGILNSIPGFLIRGENHAATYHLYKFHRAATKKRGELPTGKKLPPQHPFYGIDGYPDELAFEEMRVLALDTLIRPARTSRVVGFKEIRWNQSDLAGYVAFLQQVFPGVRFIANTRSLDGVAHSKWWVRVPNARRLISARHEKVMDMANQLGEQAYRVHYDDYTQDVENLRGMFDWLGESFDRSAIEEVMSQRHSY